MKYIKHLKTITKHKLYVMKFCFKCGQYKRGLLHDLSKFGPTEFFSSAKYYTGTSSPIDAEKKEKGYSLAWQHHKGRNPHHWEYWIDNLGTYANTPCEIPYNYMIEMCEKGILSLGYENTFNPNQTMSEREFIVFLQTYLKRSFIDEEYWKTDHINLLDAREDAITPNRAKEIMADITTYNVRDNEIKGKIEDYINLVMPVISITLTILFIALSTIRYENKELV